MTFNKLTPAEIERLAKLAEECGEIVQMVGKILVHGWDAFHPRDPQQKSNREELAKEIGGLSAVVSIMKDAGDVSRRTIISAMDDKMEHIWKYLHEQEETL